MKRDSVVEKSDGQCHTAALGYRRQPELDSVADGSLPLVDFDSAGSFHRRRTEATSRLPNVRSFFERRADGRCRRKLAGLYKQCFLGSEVE